MSIDIESLTIRELRELTQLAAKINAPQAPTCTNNGHPYKIGKRYLFRCVTHYQLGVVTAVYEHEIVLSDDAVWVVDTGQFGDACKTGELKSDYPVQPFIRAPIISRGAIVDAVEWVK